MKSLYQILLISILSSAALANPYRCPDGTTRLLTCTTAPTVNDSRVAAEYFDHIFLCQLGERVLLMVEKSRYAEVFTTRTAERAGHVTYTSVLNEDTAVEFTIPAGRRPQNVTVIGRLNLLFIGTFTGELMEFSSTHRCQ